MIDTLSTDTIHNGPEKAGSRAVQHRATSLVAQTIKNLPAMQERPGFDPRVGKIPWRREWLPTPVFWPGPWTEKHSRLQSMGTKSQT